MKTIFIDEFKKSIINKKILAVLFSYIVLLFLIIKSGNSFIFIAKFLFSGLNIQGEVLLIYYSLAILAPFFVILLSFDAIEGETSTKSMSFLVLRKGRTSILLGKFFASSIVILLTNLVFCASGVIYFYLKNGDLFLVDCMFAWLYLIPYSLVFISIGFFTSIIAKKEQTALWGEISIWSFFIFIWIKGYFVYLSPFHYVNHFLGNNIIEGVVVLSLFSIFWIGASLFVFWRKDL